MMRLNLQLTMGSFSLTLFGLIGVAFGMNLTTAFEDVSPCAVKCLYVTLFEIQPVSVDLSFSVTGPSCFLAGNWLHVFGQWADMETPLIVSRTASRTFNPTIGNPDLILPLHSILCVFRCLQLYEFMNMHKNNVFCTLCYVTTTSRE